MPISFRKSSKSTLLATVREFEKNYPHARSGKKYKHRLTFENTAPYAAWVHLRKGFFVINPHASVAFVSNEITRSKGSVNAKFPYNKVELQAMLDRSGKKILAWHTSLIGGRRRGGWKDRTGTMAKSYRYMVDGQGWKTK